MFGFRPVLTGVPAKLPQRSRRTPRATTHPGSRLGRRFPATPTFGQPLNSEYRSPLRLSESSTFPSSAGGVPCWPLFLRHAEQHQHRAGLALAAWQAGRMFRESALNPSGSAVECCAALNRAEAPPSEGRESAAPHLRELPPFPVLSDLHKAQNPHPRAEIYPPLLATLAHQHAQTTHRQDAQGVGIIPGLKQVPRSEPAPLHPARFHALTVPASRDAWSRAE